MGWEYKLYLDVPRLALSGRNPRPPKPTRRLLDGKRQDEEGSSELGTRYGSALT